MFGLKKNKNKKEQEQEQTIIEDNSVIEDNMNIEIPSSMTEEEFQQLLERDGTTILETPSLHNELAEFLHDYQSGYETPAPKILNDYLNKIYNLSLLSIVEETNGKRSIVVLTVVDHDENQYINNMMLKSADTISKTAQLVGERSYSFFQMFNKENKNQCAVYHKEGTYSKMIKNEIIAHTSTQDLLETIDYV